MVMAGGIRVPPGTCSSWFCHVTAHFNPVSQLRSFVVQSCAKSIWPLSKFPLRSMYFKAVILADHKVLSNNLHVLKE